MVPKAMARRTTQPRLMLLSQTKALRFGLPGNDSDTVVVIRSFGS